MALSEGESRFGFNCRGQRLDYSFYMQEGSRLELPGVGAPWAGCCLSPRGETPLPPDGGSLLHHHRQKVVAGVVQYGYFVAAS